MHTTSHTTASLVPLGVCPSWFIGRVPEYVFDSCRLPRFIQVERVTPQACGLTAGAGAASLLYFWTYAAATAVAIALLFL